MSEGTRAVAGRSVLWMLDWMDTRHGTVTTEMIGDNSTKMDVVFVDNGTISVTKFISDNHSAAHRFAEANNEALPMTTKVRHLTNAFTP
jgi:hypothetical protein